MTGIKISDKLKDVLIEFESESLVARLLLSKENGGLVSDPINYISISEQDSTKISYLTTDRVAKLLKSIESETSESIRESIIWHSSIRFHSRPGAVISKIFSNIDPREVEKFSNLYRANVLKPKFSFKIVSGEDIRKFYHYDNYGGEGRGSLGNSCMKHAGCQKFFDIYVQNPRIISMLVMLDQSDLVIGRALLWNLDSHKVMDRIYTIGDEEFSFYFKKWATDHGYIYKTEQNYFNTLWFESLTHKKEQIKIDIKIDAFDHRYYPYFDTFKWINTAEGTLHNYIPKVDNTQYIKTLVASDGSKLNWDFMVFDQIDNIHRYGNECNFVSYLNITTHQQNIYFSEINNQWILRSDSKFDDEIGDYIFANGHEYLNDNASIEKRRSLIRERREKEAQREKIRTETLLRHIQSLSETNDDLIPTNSPSIIDILTEAA